MMVVAVTSRKGGVGKTTVSVNLGLAARRVGLKAMIADADPLRSTSTVFRQRADVAGLLVETAANKLFALVHASSRGGIDLLVIDTPPAPADDLLSAARVADLTLVVTRPSYVDLAAPALTQRMYAQARFVSVALLNQCPPQRNGLEAPQVRAPREALSLAGLTVLQPTLGARALYQRALGHAASVVELEDNPAAVETMALLNDVLKELHLGAAAAPSNVVNLFSS